MRRRAKIVGVQLHHSVFLHDAMRGALNVRAGINSARVRRPEDPVLIELEKRAGALARDVSRVQAEAQERLRSFPLDVLVPCRNGECPYPDEPAEWP
jgi:hypothetical protein